MDTNIAGSLRKNRRGKDCLAINLLVTIWQGCFENVAKKCIFEIYNRCIDVYVLLRTTAQPKSNFGPILREIILICMIM